MPFNFFKKAKVENAESLHEMSVILPKSKREVSVEKLVNDADAAALVEGKPMMANGDHKVKVGEDEMSVNELVEKYQQMCDASKKQNEEEKPENEEEKKKENGDDEEALKKAKDIADHEKKEIAEKKQNAFNKLKDAPLKNKEKVIETSEDRVARGKARYGKN